MILDAKDLILGRMATVVARKALLGEKITIINCEKVVVSGTKEQVLARYKQKKARGTYKGPFLLRKPEALVKRTIRGMLPYKSELGKKALKNIKCYTGQPEEFKDTETIENANISKLTSSKYTTIGRISQELGAK